MGAIDRNVVETFLATGANGTSTADQGRALEELICYVFTRVPGISITRRNQLNVFQTEEIDIALWNDATADGLFFLPNIVLVECKNWSHPVGSSEVSWFDNKLRSRGLNYGILIATNGITGNARELTAAHSLVAGALREGRRLLVFQRHEILSLKDAGDLIRMVKEKLCDLAVLGSVT
ncbi:MAG TPA: restriction endonuclease [Steroidobacteraceae bacterium]|nr:restriction endonuclease [Steroidobacteraceae bacterium]